MTREAATRTIRDTYSPDSRDEYRSAVSAELLHQAIDETADLIPPFNMAEDREKWEFLPSRVLIRMAELCLDREEADHVLNAELCIP
jgi:hypothetical protein